MRRSLLVLCSGLAALLVALCSPVSAQNAARVALIIGNSSYPDASTPLATTVNDARTLADEFRRLRFDVDLKENVGKANMQRAINAFLAKIKKGSEALFYFSGFGLQADRRSYLIPIDAEVWTEADVRRDGVSIDDLLAEMHRRGAPIKIIIIDAARPNPFERRFRASPAGLAPLGATEGTLALYSTAPGTVIRDSDTTATRSALVTELIKQLRTPDQTAEQAFNLTRIGVSRATNNEIVPWVASTLLEEFRFEPGDRASAGGPTPPSVPATASPPAPRESQPREQPQIAETPRQASGSGRLAPASVFRDCGNCPEMVVVAAGAFTMGARTDYAEPRHRVTIQHNFAIGRYEITFDEWDRCVDDGGCKTRPDDRGWGRGKRPVINVSWLDANAYAAWLSKKTGQKYRLPSEAEWEYAARGGTTSTYWWGADIGSGHANCQGCNTGQEQKTLPVGSFKPNAFGLYDTSGNIAEWVQDCWHDDYRGAPTDGSAWSQAQCQLRVLRGGAYDSDAIYVGSASRFRYDYDVPYSANGFRLVRELR